MYELFLFVGTDPEERIRLQRRSAQVELVTTSKDAPRPAVRICDPIDANVTDLFGFLSSGCDQVQFSIDRVNKQCRTPSRNPDVHKALLLMRCLEDFGQKIDHYMLQDVFPLQKEQRFDLGCVNDKSVFVPVLPLFAKRHDAALDPALDNASDFGLVQLSSKLGGVVHLVWSRLLKEQRRTLLEKLGNLSKIFPDGDKLISIAEANILVGCAQLQTLSHYLHAGVSYLEDLLRKQLVAAVGKTVGPSDFAGYMIYHNNKVFREEYRPVPFSYAIRRPDHAPEGSISLEGSLDDGSFPQPVPTMVAEIPISAPMHFALNAAANVAFTGLAHVHGLIVHQFEGDSGVRLSLSARARQFSSFVVLIGRMSGPGRFDPKYGFICQNKDEYTIPLDLETIPSAGEFKAATISISEQQQSFAKMYRGMQLASTLFAVCVIQIKPLLEQLLNLPSDSLTKEIQLTQKLMEQLIRFQIPSDLLSYGGGISAHSLDAVKRNTRKMELVLQSERIKQELLQLEEEEKAQLEQLERREITVFVKTLTGKTTTLRVEANCVVDDLKQALCAVEGIPVDQQRIIYSGTLLEHGNNRIGQYGIENESTLHLVLRLR